MQTFSSPSASRSVYFLCWSSWSVECLKIIYTLLCLCKKFRVYRNTKRRAESQTFSVLERLESWPCAERLKPYILRSFTCTTVFGVLVCFYLSASLNILSILINFPSIYRRTRIVTIFDLQLIWRFVLCSSIRLSQLKYSGSVRYTSILCETLWR